MRTLDWAVLAATIGFIVFYGLWKSRKTSTVSGYLLADRSLPWYAVALSIMATQASAVTFISTTGQAYADGMRFIQFYFGLPLAMILVSKFFVPRFRNANVFTAYEYLEKRFDSKTRVLVSLIFLIQRGLACGMVLYAPAVVLTVIFGWNDQVTTLVMGGVVILYTVFGGIRAVTWTDFQQMLIMIVGLFVAIFVAVHRLPEGVGFSDALVLAGAAGKLNAVTTNFDWYDRYNLFSGLIGGTFLALAYFGCDQSQVQRYLTGRDVQQSRVSLLFNAVAKLPMQFFILLTGAMVFVFYIFIAPPVTFHSGNLEKLSGSTIERRHEAAVAERRQAALDLLANRDAEHQSKFLAAQKQLDAVHKEATKGANDTNYIFLNFVTQQLPVGFVGLVIAVIFGAAMSVSSGEINSLATVTMVDVYQRFIKQGASDQHYLWFSRLATVFWGVYAVASAQLARDLGSLVEAVNLLGSLFYGGLLGVFLLAFFFPKVRGTAAFTGVLAGEAAIFYTHYTGQVGFLWYNVIGCAVVVLVALALSTFAPPASSSLPRESDALPPPQSQTL
ncbi:sodium:solute symporter [Bryobacter aggregatus]|uniref:sodium:solute symporter n=1 Tax=Bryobacter aggregatus TaxID=360054 RepID=UPI00068AEDD1|nr:sodium:solute symporter [Bryobacter aggregatus]